MRKKQYDFGDQEIQDGGGHDEQRTDSYSGEPPVKRKRLSLSHKRVSLEEEMSPFKVFKMTPLAWMSRNLCIFLQLDLSSQRVRCLLRTLRAHQWALKVSRSG